MITDEQITDIFKKHGCYIDADMSLMRAVRETIALAQQVKPLKFWPCKLAFSADPTPYLRAESVIGPYLIYRSTCQNEKTNYHFSGVHSQSENMLTEAEAIEAANADYRKRVLSCLVWGGGE